MKGAKSSKWMHMRSTAGTPKLSAHCGQRERVEKMGAMIRDF